MSENELPSAASPLRRWPAPLYPSLRIDNDGLTLGAGSRLARMEGGTRRLALERDRVLALLSVAYRRPVAAGALVHIEAAAAYWRHGDAALANIRLALARFPRLDDPVDAARLRLAEYCLDEGLSPHALVRELGLESEALGKYGYDPDEPRDARGRWTDEPGVQFVVDDATDRASARHRPIVVASSEQRPPPGSLPPKEDATADVPGTAFEAPPPTELAPVVLPHPGGGLPVESPEASAPQVPALPTGIGVGPFAGKSVPAGPGRRPTEAQRNQVTAIGRESGCHTCGTKDPGTDDGYFYCDHQGPTALNIPGTPQSLFPHCKRCSCAQGGRIMQYLRQRMGR